MRAQIIPIVYKHGWFYAICNNDAWTPRLETYYIINYYVSFAFLFFMLAQRSETDSRFPSRTVQVYVSRYRKRKTRFLVTDGVCGSTDWELADTVFLVVKKKPLMFLHVFHHTATAALCYTQLNGRTSVSWVPIVANLTVHVFMCANFLFCASP